MKTDTSGMENVGKMLEKWQKLEDITIQSAAEIAAATANPFVATVMRMIEHDSRKHKLVLQAIEDSSKTEALHLSPDELAELTRMLYRHLALEADAIEVASAAYKHNRLFSTAFLVSALIQDEMKHHRMINEIIDSLKLESIASSSGVRSAWV